MQVGETRAAADPCFIRSQAEGLVAAYLNGHDPLDPAASPLYTDLSGLPPVRVLVGEDEVLLDDSIRFAERAVAAGIDVRLDVWGRHGAWIAIRLWHAGSLDPGTGSHRFFPGRTVRNLHEITTENGGRSRIYEYAWKQC